METRSVFGFAFFFLALAIFFSSLASAGQFDLVLNCRSTEAAGFNTLGASE